MPSGLGNFINTQESDATSDSATVVVHSATGIDIVVYDDPAELLTEQFPVEPYDFFNLPVASAPGLGPIKAILATYQTLLVAFVAAIIAFIGQTTVQTATGPYLDAHGVLYGVLRYPGELDPAYRARILAQLSVGKLTIPAIQANVQFYENGLSIISGGTPVTALVYDAESNPTLVAEDTAAGQPVPVFYFVVQLSSEISIDDVAFCDYCACDDEAYLFPGGTLYFAAADADPNLIATITRVRAANTIPIVKTVVTFDSAVDPQNPSI